MKLKDIIDQVIARVDEDRADIDPNAMETIKNAINQAYAVFRTTIDKRLATVTKPQANPLTGLPEDLVSIVKLEHSKDGEYSRNEYEHIGDQIDLYTQFSSRSGDISITYVQFPEPLTADEQEIALKSGYIHGVVAFGAYAYQLYRKKYSAAQLLLSEYNSILQLEQKKPKN